MNTKYTDMLIDLKFNDGKVVAIAAVPFNATTGEIAPNNRCFSQDCFGEGDRFNNACRLNYFLLHLQRIFFISLDQIHVWTSKPASDGVFKNFMLRYSGSTAPLWTEKLEQPVESVCGPVEQHWPALKNARI